MRGSALPESDAVFPGGKGGGAGSGQKRDCNRQWNMVISTYKLCRISPGLVKIQKAGWFRKGTRTAFCVIWGSVDFLTEDAGNASLQKSRETCKNADCRGTRQEEQTDEGDKTGALPGTAAQARQLKAWLKENGEKPGAALPALQKAQEIYGYVPREVQQLIADALHKPLTEIYGVVHLLLPVQSGTQGAQPDQRVSGDRVLHQRRRADLSAAPGETGPLETGAAPRTAASAWMPAAAWAAAGWRR